MKDFRLSVARQLMRLPFPLLGLFFGTEAGRRILKLASSELLYQDLDRDEEAFIGEFAAEYGNPQDQENFIRYLLINQLFFWPHQIRTDCAPGDFLTWLPHDLLEPAVTLLLRSPTLFREVGECDAYAEYLRNIVSAVHGLVQNRTLDNASWCQALALVLIRFCIFTPLYFARGSMLEVTVKRAEIAEFVIQSCGGSLDGGVRATGRKFPKKHRIRLAVFIPVLTARSETYVVVPLLKYLDRKYFSVTLFCVVDEDIKTKRFFQDFVERIVVLPNALEKAIETVRRDDQDMLIYATNLTVDCAAPSTVMAAHRLAPIQIADTCSPVTTGLRNIDYYLSGSFTEPPTAGRHYSESLILIDGAAQSYEVFSSSKEENNPSLLSSSILEGLDIPSGSIVYISGANFYKIIPELRCLWAKILAAVPNSYMILYPFNPNWSRDYFRVAFEKLLFETGEQYGVSAERWKIVGPFENRNQIIELNKCADVYLDSIRHSGAVSLLDPLRAVLPLVVLEGEFGRGRQASAILRSLGLEQYICRNEMEYVDMAVKLGVDKSFCQLYVDRVASSMRRNPVIFNGRLDAEKVGEVLLRIVSKKGFRQ